MYKVKFKLPFSNSNDKIIRKFWNAQKIEEVRKTFRGKKAAPSHKRQIRALDEFPSSFSKCPSCTCQHYGRTYRRKYAKLEESKERGVKVPDDKYRKAG